MSAELLIRSSRSQRRARRSKRRSGASERDDGRRPARRFVLYVEGPRDRDLLRIWARRVSHGLARSLESCVVIMGGRQPERAAEHFARVQAGRDGASGLVVLDRDHHDPAHDWAHGESLDLFTWPRRHIESYVLVPTAIRRAVGSAPDDPRVERLLAEHLPAADDDDAFLEVDAKRLLAAKGPLARGLGQPLSTADIARCMRLDELHDDVLGVLERVGAALGHAGGGPEIVVRSRTP
jgi:hypothetical protein